MPREEPGHPRVAGADNAALLRIVELQELVVAAVDHEQVRMEQTLLRRDPLEP